MRGNVTEAWQAASAHIVSGEGEQAANRLLDRKYFLKRILNVLTKLNRHKRAMLKDRVDLSWAVPHRPPSDC
jgi:hypothetical protein